MFLHQGIRLFDRIDPKKIALEIVETPHSPPVTHLRYNVKKV